MSIASAVLEKKLWEPITLSWKILRFETICSMKFSENIFEYMYLHSIYKQKVDLFFNSKVEKREEFCMCHIDVSVNIRMWNENKTKS